MNQVKKISFDQLNQDQQKASTDIFQFLMSPETEFSLSGPAGTGKTFLMNYIMNNVLSEYEDACQLLGIKPIDWEVVLTATTHKATDVLGLSTGFSTSTVHSFLMLKVQDDYTTGVSKITKGNNWHKQNNKLLFIDEASMIDEQLYKLINESLGDNCKVIYLGDHCQLAPVNERISKVYSEPRQQAKLTIPMRNAGQPALGALCTQLRHTVETLEFNKMQSHPGVIDYVDGPTAQAYIDQVFIDPDVDARILCFTNSRVNQYAQYIRDLRGYPEHLAPGEHVILNNTMTVGKNLIHTETEFKIREVSALETIVLTEDEHGVNGTFQIRYVTALTMLGGVFVLMVPEDKSKFDQLKKALARKKSWQTFYALKNLYADLRPRDASTVYKSQGSTFDTAFIDIGNIGTSYDAEQVARMLYVAISRAKNRVIFFGSLPSRYIQSQPTTQGSLAFNA